MPPELYRKMIKRINVAGIILLALTLYGVIRTDYFIIAVCIISLFFLSLIVWAVNYLNED